MSELFKDIIDKIKKRNIKRKSENILCPYCLHDYLEIFKRSGWKGLYPIYKCCQCKALCNYDGKKLKTPIFIENAPEDFTLIYRENDIKKIPFPELTTEEKQDIEANIDAFIEKIKGSE